MVDDGVEKEEGRMEYYYRTRGKAYLCTGSLPWTGYLLDILTTIETGRGRALLASREVWTGDGNETERGN